MTTHIEREHAGFTNTKHYKYPRNESNSNEVEKLNNNNRTFLVGPSFSDKSYLMSKILSRMPDRDNYMITKSPLEQFLNSKMKIKEIEEEIKPLSEYEKAIIVFDDILGSSNSRFMDQFFFRGRHNNLDIYYLSQSYFD